SRDWSSDVCSSDLPSGPRGARCCRALCHANEHAVGECDGVRVAFAMDAYSTCGRVVDQLVCSDCGSEIRPALARWFLCPSTQNSKIEISFTCRNVLNEHQLIKRVNCIYKSNL